MARFIDESAKQAPDHEKKILIVSGCLSQRYGKELADEMPEVDIFLGVNDYEKLPQLVKEYRKGKRLQAFSCQPDAFYEFSARKIKDNPYSMTLRIAEGCNNCCAYCVIPQIRGAYRSRPMENIIEEAEAAGVKGLQRDYTDRSGRDRIRYGYLRQTDAPGAAAESSAGSTA